MLKIFIMLQNYRCLLFAIKIKNYVLVSVTQQKSVYLYNILRYYICKNVVINILCPIYIEKITYSGLSTLLFIVYRYG